jgi:hypothetical protein
MTINGTSEALRTARVWQPLVCLGLLASIALSVMAIETAVHSEALGAWMDREWAKVNSTSNEYRRQYLDTEDRVVLQDLADLDTSQGGVYFFGASNMKWATRFLDLPPDERKLVHNFGAGEGSPYFNQQLTEYLVRQKDLLQAGPEKTLIVYGTGFINAKPSAEGTAAFFPNLWRRYGLYTYDYKKGVEPICRGNWLDAYSLEKARCSSFMQGAIDRAGRMAVPKALRRRRAEKDPAAFAADYQRRMGPDWEANIDLHRKEMQAWFDYVKSQKMDFAIVLLPLASWHQPLPYPPKYRAMIEDFCKKNRNADGREVPLYDLTAIAGDDDFGDHIHMNAQGLPKTDAALMDIARTFLEKTGAWPKKQ